MPLWIQNIEGASLIISAILIFLTLRRKGKNRLLFILAWLFLTGGLFRAAMLAPRLLGWAGLGAWFVPLSDVICNSALFFGLAGYISMQLRFLGGSRTGQIAFWTGMALAVVLTILNLLAAGLIPGFSPAVSRRLAPYQLRVMLTALGSSFVFLLAMFGLFWARARRQGRSFLSNSALNFGLGLMLIAWILQKIVPTGAGSTLAVVLSFLPFAGIGTVIAAIFIQASAVMRPGIISHIEGKQPVGLAVVRVFRTHDKKLLESRVTSADGRYGILVEPGTYNLSVQATGFSFPTRVGVGYRGETLTIKQPTVLGFDVFLDPIAT